MSNDLTMIPIVIIYVCSFTFFRSTDVEAFEPNNARAERLGYNLHSSVCGRNVSGKFRLLRDDDHGNQGWCGDYWYKSYDDSNIEGTVLMTKSEGVVSGYDNEELKAEYENKGNLFFKLQYPATHTVQFTYCTKRCEHERHDPYGRRKINCRYYEYSTKYKITNFRCLSKNLAPSPAAGYSDEMTVHCGIKSSRYTYEIYWVRNGVEKLSSLDGHHVMTYRLNDPGMFGKYECTQVFYDPLFTKITYNFEIREKRTIVEKSTIQKILKADCMDSNDTICQKVRMEVQYDKSILLNQRMKGFKLMYRPSDSLYKGDDANSTEHSSSITEDTVKFSDVQRTDAGVSFNWITNVSIPGILSIEPIDFFGVAGNRLSHVII